MPTFEYLTFTCTEFELQERLSTFGTNGWRLHTCEPILPYGPAGTGVVRILVVLDKFNAPAEEEGSSPEPLEQGIPMRG